jgi:hypothetical protein
VWAVLTACGASSAAHPATGAATALTTPATASPFPPFGGATSTVAAAPRLPATVPDRPPLRAAAPGPPYPVQEITVPLVDRTRPTVSEGRTISSVRTLTTELWVPAAPGRRPLVVFAHGFDVGPATYGALLQAWATHGYVVAAPELPLTDPVVAGANLDEADINNQPADLRFVTGALTAPGSPISARIDSARVAVTGHSDGAESALAASLLPGPAGGPRYRALIAMSVQPLPGYRATANPPILVTQGDVDTINPPAYGLQTWQAAASPKYLLTLHGGGHLPPLQAGSTWLPGIEAVTEAFLDAYLAGDASPSSVAATAAGYGVLAVHSG